MASASQIKAGQRVRLLPARINDKPQYVLHPLRLLRRALHAVRPAGSDAGAAATALADLPWGLELEVHRGDAIGYTILTSRVFDPCVTETLHRLIDPGDSVVDVGANVGYLTSLAAARAGASGSVLAFEPHPRVFELLARNSARWRGRPDTAPVEIHQAAISDAQGRAELASGPLFDQNMGLASLHTGGAAGDVDLFEVAVQRLDDLVGERPVGLLKIDVEGHEPAVLRGARDLLAAGRVRDVVFEDHEVYPDACTELLQACGYELFSLENDLFGLRLVAPADRGSTRAWPGPSYLATLDAPRALARLSPRGWRVAGIGLRPVRRRSPRRR
jgi:FkbM family methyltransferase